MIKIMLGNRIKDYRKSIGLSQVELAEKIGVRNTTISSWETNRTEPTMKDVVKLCEIFDCKVNDLVVVADVELPESIRECMSDFNLALRLTSYADYLLHERKESESK